MKITTRRTGCFVPRHVTTIEDNANGVETRDALDVYRASLLNKA